MSIWAIFTMIVVQALFTLITVYFFVKVLRTPKNKEPADIK
jgi:hypothetical protein